MHCAIGECRQGRIACTRRECGLSVEDVCASEFRAEHTVPRVVLWIVAGGFVGVFLVVLALVAAFNYGVSQ